LESRHLCWMSMLRIGSWLCEYAQHHCSQRLINTHEGNEVDEVERVFAVRDKSGGLEKPEVPPWTSAKTLNSSMMDLTFRALPQKPVPTPRRKAGCAGRDVVGHGLFARTGVIVPESAQSASRAGLGRCAILPHGGSLDRLRIPRHIQGDALRRCGRARRSSLAD
jgi:hypothetical protein